MTVPSPSLLVRQGNFLFRVRNFLPLPVLLYVVGLQLTVPLRTELIVGARIVALCLALVGLGIRAIVIGHVAPGTSSRATGAMTTDSLNTDGLYSLVRHPLYVGNLFLWIAVGVLGGHLEGIVFAALWFGVLYDRITRAEEDHLQRSFGPVWFAWAERTRRFLPRPARYARAVRSFSIRPVIAREFHTAYVLVVLVAVVEVARWLSTGEGSRMSTSWWAMTLTMMVPTLIGLAQTVRSR